MRELTDPAVVGGGMALTAAALWSISTTLYKGAVIHFGPRAMNLFRCTIAFALFWITSLALHGNALFEVIPTRAGLLLLGSGVLGLAVGDHFLFHAMLKLGAHPAIAMNQLSPVWSAFVGFLLGVEVLSLREYLAIGLVIVGVLLVIFSHVAVAHVDDSARLAARRARWLGIGAGLISSFCTASAALMAKEVIAQVGALQGSTLRLTGSAVFLASGSLVMGRFHDDSIALRTVRHRHRELIAVFISSFLAIFLQQGAFARIDASVALCLLSTTPIFLLPLAVGILHERYRWTAVLGTLLAMAGVPLLVLHPKPAERTPMVAPMVFASDPHSFARPEQARVRHLDLDVAVDFEKQELSGRASLRIEAADDAGELILDTRDLRIDRVTVAGGAPDATGPDAATAPTYGRTAVFKLGAAQPDLGAPLTITLPRGTRWVNVFYATTPGAAALQWLAPEQTADGRQPFLFTQSQAILARTWVPCQDSPGVRMTYTARVSVPKGLLALMSAENPQARAADGIYRFRMPQPIPSYLLALAVGDIDFRSAGPRTGVYAEKSVVEKAAFELDDLEKMVTAAEALYGPYRWERYDVIVLPPSFPFGGMENPRLTFATPTILAGDRSLVSLVAHELAHSWSGNLVTNATWNDFWLNEGFTVYFEHRIMQAVFGQSFDDALAVLGLQDLEKSLDELKEKPADTCLKLDLAGRNPDDGMTDIAYEKGARFLQVIEGAVGRDRFDVFLRKWFDANAFQSRTTEEFLAFLRSDLIAGDAALEAALQVDAWVYRPGLPSNCPRATSKALDRADKELARFVAGAPAAGIDVTGFTTQQWQHFLRKLPPDLTSARTRELDIAFGLSQRGNSEVLFAWLVQCVAHHYEPAFGALDHFLTSQGRRKFLKPLYQELVKSDWGRELAARIYARARPTYHAVARETIDGIMQEGK